MRQIQDKQQIIYIEDERPEYQVVYVRRQPSRRRPLVNPFAPFYLGLVTVLAACFLVTDVDWLVRRAGAALLILLLVGVVGSIILAFRETLTTRWWED